MRRCSRIPLSCEPRARESRTRPRLPLFDVTTLEAVLAASIDGERFRLLLLVMAGWVALVLAGVGIFGVVLYLLARCIPEIGVRLALGARELPVRGGASLPSRLLLSSSCSFSLARSGRLRPLHAMADSRRRDDHHSVGLNPRTDSTPRRWAACLVQACGPRPSVLASSQSAVFRSSPSSEGARDGS